MNREKMNIKMDLLRVAKTALDIDKKLDTDVAATFINKAKEEFKKVKDPQKTLINELIRCEQNITSLGNDPEKRKKWGEKILTIASRLSNN